MCRGGIGMSDLACGFGEAGWHTGGDQDLPDGQLLVVLALVPVHVFNCFI